MKKALLVLFSLSLMTKTHALVINEIMSNPTGDDGGREWVEIYNESAEAVDLSTLTVSIKGGTPSVVTPVSGGTTLPAFGYAIIGSVVSGATKFALDYPAFSGPLFKSSISLVNTGVTSIDIRLNGAVVSSVASYTGAKEGSTYSLISGSYTVATPTPGAENQAASNTNNTPTDTQTSTTTQTSGNQSTIPQMSPPSADIVLFLPVERTVVAGAPVQFSVYALTNAGRAIDNMIYSWAFGEGGTKTGSTTEYRYLYPGRYIAQVEGTNSLVAGTARMLVKVVSPDIVLSEMRRGKYGPYISITNPNTYDLDVSGWKISIDGAVYPFPKNTLLGIGETKVTGQALGFASTTVSTSTVIKLLFPNMDEVLRVTQGKTPEDDRKTSPEIIPLQTTAKDVAQKAVSIRKNIPQPAKPTAATTSSKAGTSSQKDTRIASFIRSFFR